MIKVYYYTLSFSPQGVPSLVDAMLPPAEGSKLARQWLARTLAVPPPEGVGKAIRVREVSRYGEYGIWEGDTESGWQ